MLIINVQFCSSVPVNHDRLCVQTDLTHNYLCQGGFVFSAVCLSVCSSVSSDTKTTGQICLKLGEGWGTGSGGGGGAWAKAETIKFCHASGWRDASMNYSSLPLTLRDGAYFDILFIFHRIMHGSWFFSFIVAFFEAWNLWVFTV